ncbi:MAG: LptF/LptG family permease [Spirulinaceae cyanobacterium]
MASNKPKLSTQGLWGFSLLDRYIATEIILPFLFIVGLVSSLGLAAGTIFDIVRQITEYGLMLTVALQYIFLKLPQFVAYAFPVSMLLATLMAYSRLSTQSELIALRSVGVSVYRLVIPALIFSLFVSGLTFAFNEYIVQSANYQAAVILEKALGQDRPTFKEENIFYPEYTEVQDEDGDRRKVLSRLFYAEQFDGREMYGVTIFDRSQDGVNQIISAQSASWNLQENKWDFNNGTIYLVAPDGSYRNILRFDRQLLQLPRSALDFAQRDIDPSEMNISQAVEYMEVLRVSNDEKGLRQLEARIHRAIAFPFVCVVFCLLGAAIGTQPQQGGRAASFSVAVAVVFIYYVLNFVMTAMGSVGVLPPLLAAWVANIFGFAIGAGLLVKSAQ